MKSYFTSDKQNQFKPAAEAEGHVAENTSSQETTQLKAFQKMADESEQVQQGKQFSRRFPKPSDTITRSRII